MPLTLEKCGNLGGDVEMAAVAGEFARRHPGDEVVLIGRNTGEWPSDVGLPENVTNPWHANGKDWSTALRNMIAARGLKGRVLTPEVQFAIGDVFDEIGIVDEIASLDAIVLWVGQHGTTNYPIPKVGQRDMLTKPQDWSVWYASYLLRGINRWRDNDPWHNEEIYLNADARNYHKMRDLKWPLRHPILTQFEFTNNIKHERGGDDSLYEEWHRGGYADYDGDPSEVWTAKVQNTYARLEVNGLRPGTPFGDLISFDDNYDRSGHFGLFINEARAIGVRPELQRKTILRDWIIPMNPHFINGTWSNESLDELGISRDAIRPASWSEYYPRLHSVLSTLTTPSSGSGWATAKPWEAFAAGTVCFFHPAYDTQDNILGDMPEDVRSFLRVSSVQDLHSKISALRMDRVLWQWVIAAQRKHFDDALAELTYMKMIEERIYG